MTGLHRPDRDGLGHHMKGSEMLAEETIVKILDLLHPAVILHAFEEETEGEEEEESEEESEEEEEEEEEEEDDGAKGLKSALRKEREARKVAQKQFKALQQQLDEIQAKDAKDDKAKTDAQKRQAEANEAKLQKVAVGFAKNALDTALTRALQDPKMPKFQDPDDVLRLINRDEIDIDQDDDDPSDITIDQDDIRKEIKRLAKKKPHLLVPDEKSDEESGGAGGGNAQGKAGQKTRTGKFNGKGGANGQETDEQKRARLSGKYKALQSRR